MKNKFINLLSQEPNFRLKLGAVILLVVFSFFSYRGMGSKRAEIAKLHQDKLVALELKKQIPALEDKLRGFEAENVPAVGLKSSANLILKGIFTKGNESAALINNDIYQKNDMVSGLIITEIASNAVTLEDPITAEQSKIQLPE
jgi:hypothetical protein